jgi:hypothetical protein
MQATRQKQVWLRQPSFQKSWLFPVRNIVNTKRKKKPGARQTWHEAFPSRMTGQIINAKSSRKLEAQVNGDPMNMGFTQQPVRLVDNHGLTQT